MIDERFYHFVGRIIGLAVFHKHFLDAVFVPSFYKGLVCLSTLRTLLFSWCYCVVGLLIGLFLSQPVFVLAVLA